MSDIKDNPPPLPKTKWKIKEWEDLYRAGQAEAFARGVAAGQASMQGEVKQLQEAIAIHLDTWQLQENMLDELRAKLKALEEQEPAAWMFPDDLERFKTTEATATSFSVKVGSPDAGTSLPLYTAAGAKE